MTGTITIRLDDGRLMSGTIQFAVDAKIVDQSSPSEALLPHSSPRDELDFTLPIRPFMNQHAEGLSGSKKFALMVAYFVKGEIDVPADRAEILESWNKMTGLLGGKFNGAHESRAKDSGYVYVPESGKLALLKKWRQVLH